MPVRGGTLLKTLAKITQPHLGRILFNKQPTLDWHLRTDKPYAHIFEPSNTQRSKVNKPREYTVGSDSRHPYRILCLDGGGIRGVLTTQLLVRIVRHNPKFLDSIDLIVGTSAGGILALLLAAGYNAQECDEIYAFAAPHIFLFNPWRAINPFKSKYSDKQKQEIFEYYWGQRTMKDLHKHAAVVSFRLDGRRSSTHSFFNKDGWRPAVFSNLPQAGSSILPDDDLYVWDAAMRTSAAPTFFPVFRGYTDGGIVANNPSIVAVSKAMAHYPFLSSGNIAVLSLGAGSFPRHTNVFSAGKGTVLEADLLKGEGQQLYRADWGIKQWVPFLLDLLLDGDTTTTEMVMHYLLGGNKLYHRLDPALPHPIALDDLSSVELLREYAQTVDISATLKFIENNFTDDSVSTMYGDHMLSNSLDNSSSYHSAWEQTLHVKQSRLDKASLETLGGY